MRIKNPLSSGKAQNKNSRNKRHWRLGRAGARPPGGRVFIAQRKQGLFGGLERGLRRGGTPLTGPFPPPGGHPTKQNEKPSSVCTTPTKQMIFSLLPSRRKTRKKDNWIPAFAGMTKRWHYRCENDGKKRLRGNAARNPPAAFVIASTSSGACQRMRLSALNQVSCRFA